MLKFFRNIRKTNIIEGKTVNYFKYAIGEIILVVIGILIALQINNWNEGRQKQQELSDIYKTVTYEDYINDKVYRNLLFGFPDYSIQNRSLNLLTQYSDSYSNKKDELTLQIMRFYSVNLTEIRADERELQVDFDDNSLYWKNNESWFAYWNLEISDEGFIDYALKSDDYLNRVSSFYFYYYHLLIPHLQTYMKEAKKLLML